MTIDPVGNLTILSDVSLNGNTIDIGTGVITGVGNENFPTNIDIRQNNVPRIYTSGVNMTIDPAGKLSILSDVSLNGNTFGMDSGNIIDVSGIYGLSNNTLHVDASSVLFTNGTQTHMVIDNCGIILNDISYSDTGTVLSFNRSNNRVHYYTLYDTSYYDISLVGGTGVTTHSYNMKISKVVDTVTLNIPDASCVITGGAPDSNIQFSMPLDASYCPSRVIHFPAIVYDNTTYLTGKFKVTTNGSMTLYKSLDETASWASGNIAGMLGQCFTYTV